MPTISQRAVDKIVGYEVSSRSYYDKVLQRPEWPGGASGVTVGIGYDLGCASTAKIAADWSPHVPAPMLEVMKSCSGISGSAAKAKREEVKNQILIPWDAAMAVFLNRDIPEWTRTVCSRVPLADQMSPDCLGALVSLAYNRGAGGFDSSSDRFREMHSIKLESAAKQWDKIPDEFRSMKRLWPDMAGLRKRRDDEAALFELGLRMGSVAPATHTANEKPPNLPQPPITSQESGSVVTTGGATAGTAKTAAESGASWWQIVAIIVVGLLITGVIVYFVRKNRQPVLARQKDNPNVGPVTAASTDASAPTH